MKNYNNWEEFNDSLAKALYEQVPQIFTKWNFQRYKNGWQSPLKIDGTQPKHARRDKTYINSQYYWKVGEQGAEGMTLKSFYMQQVEGLPAEVDVHSEQYIEAEKRLARLVGVEYPKLDRAGYKESYNLEGIVNTMTSNLWKPEGKETLDYLYSRGYTQEEVAKMAELGLGCILPENYKAIRKIEQENKVEILPNNIENEPSYRLVIPFLSGGIKGLTIRSIASTEYLDSKNLPKYKYTKGEGWLSSSVYGIGPKYGQQGKDVTIVEGPLDAIHAIVKGVRNILAIGGSSLNTKQVELIKRAGATRITLLYDTEGKENDNEDEYRKRIQSNYNKRNKAIETIKSLNVEVCIADLPSMNGEKVDVDSYLVTHTTEELEEIIRKAKPAYIWNANTILEKYRTIATSREEKRLTEKESKDLIAEVVTLANKADTIEAKDILLELQIFSGNRYTIEELKEFANQKKEETLKEEQKEKLVEVLASGLRTSRNGETIETIKTLESELQKVKHISEEAELDKELEVVTSEQLLEMYRNAPESIETGYAISNSQTHQTELFTIPSGAVTLICAPTSHGKSSVLRNIALNILDGTRKAGEDGTILYYTLEEDILATHAELINTYVNEELTAESKRHNNLQTIHDYLRTGSTQYIKHEALPIFNTKIQQYWQMVNSGKLRVNFASRDNAKLVRTIEYSINKLGNVKAIFIDYVQKLHIDNTNLQRNKELEQIIGELESLAIETGKPIVLAGQLSRQALSPAEMVNQYIADSADLERSANKVLLVWNSQWTELPQSKWSTLQNTINAEKRPELGKVNKDINGDNYTQLYVKLTKNRAGEANMDALLKFYGNTGKIETNNELVKTEEDKYKNEDQAVKGINTELL